MENNNPPSGKMDWDNFQNIFKNKNFTGDSFFDMSKRDPQWIEDYVQKILNQSMPNMNRDEGTAQGPIQNQPEPQKNQPQRSLNQPAPLQKEMFEGHYHIIIRVLLPPQVHPKQLRIFHAANQLRIEGLPNQGPEIIELPCLGITQGAVSVVKNHILEINIPKESQYNFAEIPITYE